MGKQRKQKVHKAKVHPTGVQSMHEAERMLEAAGEIVNENACIEQITDQLTSANLDEKLVGLQLLGTIAQNAQNIPKILSCDIIRIAGPYLVDGQSLTLRHASAGAFRTLSACGIEVCDTLVERDVMTPLLALLGQFKRDWTPILPLDELGETFLHAVHTMGNLCETSAEALEQFNASQLLGLMVSCLNYSKYGLDTSIAVAQLLLIVSEDNSSSWKAITAGEVELVSLMEIVGGFGEILLRTLAAAIVANVPTLANQHQAAIIRSLEVPFNEDHRTALMRLSSELPLVEDAKRLELDVIQDDEMTDEPNGDHDDDEDAIKAATMRQRKREAQQIRETEEKVKQIGFLLEAQRMAAEILTNVSSYDEDKAAAEDDEECDSEEESVHDYDQVAAVGNGNGMSGEAVTADRLPVELLEAIRAMNLVEKLWLRAQPVPENVYEILARSEKGLTNKLKMLRVSCLLCLHNLCNVMVTDDLGGPASIYKVWIDLGQQIFQGANKDDAHLLEASTALMRATLEHLRHSPELFASMTESDLQLILNGVESCDEAEIRANWLRMLGSLGCLLPEPLVKLIMSFLLDASAKEQDAWTMSEAMDALMDMFADNDWPEIARALQLPQRTKPLERTLKNLLRQQKRELGERYTAVATVRTNLVRFTKYVEQELAKR